MSREQGAEEKHFRELGRKVIFLSGSREQRPPWEGLFITVYTCLFVPASLSCSLPFVPVETLPDDYLDGKELVILLFVCVVSKMVCSVLYIYFQPGVYVGTYM